SVSLQEARKGRRLVYIPESNDTTEVDVYDGDLPLSGNTITGPAIIEKVTTSIFVNDGYDCLVDNYGSFIVYNRSAFQGGFRR
ncbi:MAG: hydantoinase/oxoprolinase family protein, partial [bacterium]